MVPHHFPSFVSAEQKHNPSNKRKSTRFTWWNFFPIALALQFTKVVNIFYCVTAIMQCIPSIQTNSPMATIIPLCFVISLGILKELIAEVKRHKEDKVTNNAPVTRLAADGQLEQATLATVHVGDILKLEDGKMIPADCILLKTHAENNECFVKTAALDGERNLKPKMAIKQLTAKYDALMKDTAPAKLPFCVDSLLAMKDMYTYEGRITVNDGVTEESFPLDLNQFLHRGSYLENSEYCYALVVHTGMDTKLIKNLGQYRFKRSRFETVLNYVLIFNLLLAIVFAVAGSIANGIWTEAHINTHLYIF